MRVGILGGSFDPPHLAHRALAECAIKELSLDLLVVAVAYRQWQKHHDASAENRVEMARLNFDIPNAIVSDVDIKRATPTFSIDTLTDLSSLYPNAEFVFVTGADAIAGLASWHRASELSEKLKFAAAMRDGKKGETPAGFKVEWLNCGIAPISSTEIRELLSATDGNNSQLQKILLPSVLTYISEHELYRK